MTTTVTSTGTGCPVPRHDRAGPGVLVVHGDTHPQFDAGRSTLVLAHLIPPPRDESEEQAFADDVRGAGDEGELIVARDLTSVSLGSG